MCYKKSWWNLKNIWTLLCNDKWIYPSLFCTKVSVFILWFLKCWAYLCLAEKKKTAWYFHTEYNSLLYRNKFWKSGLNLHLLNINNLPLCLKLVGVGYKPGLYFKITVEESFVLWLSIAEGKKKVFLMKFSICQDRCLWVKTIL